MRRGGVIGSAAASQSPFDPTTFLAAEAGTNRLWFLPGTPHTTLYTTQTGSPPATPSTDGTLALTFRDNIMNAYSRSSGTGQPTAELSGPSYALWTGVSTSQYASDSTFTVRPGWYGAIAFRAVDVVSATSLIMDIQQDTSNRIRLAYVPTTGVIQFVYRLLSSTGASGPPPASVTLSSSAGVMPMNSDHILEMFLGVNVSQVRLDDTLIINSTNDWQADDALTGGALHLGAIGGGNARIYGAFMCRKSAATPPTDGERTQLRNYLAGKFTA